MKDERIFWWVCMSEGLFWLSVYIIASFLLAVAIGTANAQVMIPDTGTATNLQLPGTWTTIQDTGAGTIVMGAPRFGMTPSAGGFVVHNGGWQNMTASSAGATITCRYYNEINGALVPNMLGGDGVWMKTVPAGPFSMPIPSVWIEKGCTVNQACVTPLTDGDILRIATQCYSIPAGAVTVTGASGDMNTMVLPVGTSAPIPVASPTASPVPQSGPYCGSGIVMSNGKMCLQ